MPGQNELIQIRQAFKIPESVVIRTLPVTKIFKSNIEKPKQDFNIPEQNQPDAALYNSVLNTPVFTDIEFLSETYETKTKGQFIETPRLRYYAVLLTVSQAKKIIKTEIQGRDGTVKEYVCMDDYQVQINGIITGANGVHPAYDIALLKRVLDAPIPIPVASAYLNNLGISSLVIETYEFAQEAGGYSYQTFSITCSSDVPQELRLSNV